MTFDPATNQATAKGQRRRANVQSPPPAEPSQGSEQETPSTNEGEATETPPADPPADVPAIETKPPEPPPIPAPLAPALLELPIHTCYGDGRYAAQYVELKLSRRRAAALNFLWASWSEDGQRYENGRSGHPDGAVIENGPDALKYLLDQLADQIEAGTGKTLVTDFGFIFR